MFKKLGLIVFCLELRAEITDAQMRVAFATFKRDKAAILAPAQCANSILFLEQLTSNFHKELVTVQKEIQIEMMEKILYQGAGVGGFSGKVCNAKEYAIMTEAAVILELWHRKQGTKRYFNSKALASENAFLKKHYQVLKFLSIAVDAAFNEDGTRKFFKDTLPETVAAIRASEANMTEAKLLAIPAMRQLDVLIANLTTSLGFTQCEGNRAEDYADLGVDDGLNALRANMRALMNAETIAAAIPTVEALEASCWALPLDTLETAEADKRRLIGRAFAAVERIKSVRLDGTFLRKDSRAADDKFATLAVPVGSAREIADAKKKNTILLLRAMALQEFFYNPSNTVDDLKKIILAKLQQSNYWEGGVAAFLTDKTDLVPYPIALPADIDTVLEDLQYANTVPKVYTLFVNAIEQLAMTNKGSGYSAVGIHFVGGNRFVHLASSGAACQCGFFSFGLIDDGAASNARRKFFDIFSNNLNANILRDVAKMASVLEAIELYAKGKEEDFKLFRNIVKTGTRDVPGRPGKKEGVYEVREFYPGAQKLAEGIQTLDRAVILRELQALDVGYAAKRLTEAQRLGLIEVREGFGLLDEDPRRRGFQLLEWDNNYKKSLVCVQALQRLLLTNQDARTAFSSYAKHVLAGKLSPEELPIGVVNYLDIRQQLLFRPGSDRYQSVTDPAILTTAVSPTQTISEALNINVQVISGPGQFIGTFGQILNYQEPSRAFSIGYYVLQDILVKPTAKNQLLINFGGGHYEKLISLSDTVALARGLRHLAWMGRGIPELK